MTCKKVNSQDKYSKIMMIENSHEHQIKILPENV